MTRRQEAFKNKSQFKTDELRRRREEAQVEIRKQKRDESMAKRRNLNLASTLSGGETDDEDVVGPATDAQVSRLHCKCGAVSWDPHAFATFGVADARRQTW